MKPGMPENYGKPLIEIWHLELTRECEDSAYRSKCPFCKNGVLFVGRDIKTLRLSRYDRCISCGQLIKYLDPYINNEFFGD
jgi:hypothetical protein